MNPHVSLVNCPHSTYHHAVQFKDIPDPVKFMANQVLSTRIHLKVTGEELIYASHGPWLERIPTEHNQFHFKAHSKGYRLVYQMEKRQYCLHVGEEGNPQSIEIHDMKTARRFHNLVHVHPTSTDTKCQIL